MKFSIKDFFSKCEQIRSFLLIGSHSLKKSLMENFIFCALLWEAEGIILFETNTNMLNSNKKTFRIAT